MIKLGTRPSRLAMVQAQMVSDKISSTTNERVEIVPIKTEGDMSDNREINLKSAFTKRLEEAIANGTVDAAVHSLKDFPLDSMKGLALVSFPISDDPSDILITNSGHDLFDLRNGAVIGTGSVRRRALIELYRPDVVIKPLRGNVDTRVKKFTEEGMDGIVLSAAGINRLGLKITYRRLDPEMFIPAAGQGIIAVEAREESSPLFKNINDKLAEIRARAERAFLKRLGGDCNIPAGIYTRMQNGKIYLKGFIASSRSVKFALLSDEPDNAENAGTELAGELLH